MQGFARLSLAIPQCRVGDVEENARSVFALWQQAHDDESQVVVFPELMLSSYTARDLLLDTHLLEQCERALRWLAAEGAKLSPLCIVGAPLRAGVGLYNCAAVLQRGEVLGVVPKSYLPNYREFEERRWFRPGTEVPAGADILVAGQRVPFGTDLLFAARPSAAPDEVRSDELIVGVEICEDMWVQHPPSAMQASAGATVCVNLSASNFTVGKSDTRRLLAHAHAERTKCAYVYVAAGPGESSTDLSFDADGFISEGGVEVARSERFLRGPQLVTADVDLEALRHARIASGTFGDAAAHHRRSFRSIPFATADATGLRRHVDPHPFLPNDPNTLARRCWEIFEIQTNALATRLEAIGQPKLVLGISGGLDSTQAALVAAVALDALGRDRRDLLCVTLPGLGTSTGTRKNAERLAESLGASFREIPISEATQLVLARAGHPAAAATSSVPELLERLQQSPELGDPAFENAQARLRTLWLMTLANQIGGIVLGTGDLSEKALGWATYNGDHLSMYDVNAGVPKTLIQFVIRWVAQHRVQQWTAGDRVELRAVLEAILATPISPELLPPDAEGNIVHLTESTLGPYELHDFFLYQFLRDGARPARILSLAQVAFEERYTVGELKKWLTTFLRRFFQNQFKRSATADAPKVCPIALSPRGDWRMPSDAQVRTWLDEVAAFPG